MKTFLRNHYEKIILAFLLILFAVLLGWLVTVVQAGQLDDLKKLIEEPDGKATYPSISFSDPKYGSPAIFSSDVIWAGKSAARAQGTDLLLPFRLLECPSCHMMIPARAVPPLKTKLEGRCPNPNCGLQLLARLTPVGTQPKRVGPPPPSPDQDRNKNGVPDKFELENGLSLNDADAVNRTDEDRDGFSLKEEYLAGTSDKDPKAHPSYRTKIQLKSVRDVRVPGLTLARVRVKGESKRDWELHFSQVINGRRRTQFLKLGDTITQGRDKFEIKDVEDNPELENDEDALQETVKVTLLREGAAEPMIAQVGKPIADPVKKIALYNLLTKNTVIVPDGSDITVGTARGGEETFKVEFKNGVVRLFNSKGEAYTVVKYVEPPPEEVGGPRRPAGLPPALMRSTPNMGNFNPGRPRMIPDGD